MIAVFVLLIINMIIFLYTKQDTRLVEVKKRYKLLREHLIATGNEKFKMLHKEIIISAHLKMNDSVGYNVDKGVEIAICIDGSVNDILHVLLHELAHCTVDEYSHSKDFWGNLEKLRDVAVSIGIYEIIKDRVPFCGKHIMDK